MLNKIKDFLLSKGIIKLDTTIKKIEYLLEHLDNINLYSISFRNITEDFLEKDIITYIDTLQFILRSSLETKIISIKYINENSYKRITYSFWYSDDLKILPDNEYLKEWLLLASQFIKWAEFAKKDFNNSNNTVNSRKLSPYYLNITNIVNTILDIAIKK
jgi:hypothetical protein